MTTIATTTAKMTVETTESTPTTTPTPYYSTPEFIPYPEPKPEPEKISNNTGALTCFHCDAPNFKDCERIGAYKTCAHNEQSCMIEVRRRGSVIENVSLNQSTGNKHQTRKPGSQFIAD